MGSVSFSPKYMTENTIFDTSKDISAKEQELIISKYKKRRWTFIVTSIIFTTAMGCGLVLLYNIFFDNKIKEWHVVRGYLLPLYFFIIIMLITIIISLVYYRCPKCNASLPSRVVGLKKCFKCGVRLK